MEGVSYVQASQKNGERFNTARAYLDPARSRRNLCILTECQVTRVLIENNRAIGVEFHHKGKARRARCCGEVILSAGAIGSPHLLQHSGIGDPATLEKAGIQGIVSSPNVGRNLQEHAAVSLIMRTPHRSFNEAVVDPLTATATALNFLIHRRGAITASTGSAHVFLKTRDALDRPNIHLIFTPASWGPHPTTGRPFFPKVRSLLTGILLLRPMSRGRVEPTSPNPLQKPLVHYELVGVQDEIAQISEGVRAALRILRQPQLAVTDQDFISPEAPPLDDNWDDFVRATCFRGDHPTCTCAMGADSAAVLDPQLRVRGVSALRVADASIMPDVTSGNTNAPTIMIGEKAADIILKRPI